MADSAHPDTKSPVFAGKRNESGENAGFGIGEQAERHVKGHTSQRPRREGEFSQRGREALSRPVPLAPFRSAVTPRLGRPSPTRPDTAASPRPGPGSLGPTANRCAPRARLGRVANRQALPYSRSMGSTSTAAFTWGFALRTRKSRARGADRSAPNGAFTTMW